MLDFLISIDAPFNLNLEVMSLFRLSESPHISCIVGFKSDRRTMDCTFLDGLGGGCKIVSVVYQRISQVDFYFLNHLHLSPRSGRRNDTWKVSLGSFSQCGP